MLFLGFVKLLDQQPQATPIFLNWIFGVLGLCTIFYWMLGGLG